MDCSLADIRVFREVARLGTVSAASRALGLSQPTLTWTLKKLERTLEQELFVRTPKGMTLTQAGKALLARSERLVSDFQELMETLADQKTGVAGQYTLGVYPTIAGFTVPSFLRTLMEAHPALELRLVHGFSRHISEGVIEGHIDFGIVVNPPYYADLTILDLYRDEIKFWTLPEPAPLQRWQDEHALVLHNPDLLQTESLMRQAQAAGWLKAKRRLATSDLRLIRNLTASGAGIGLMPETVAFSATRTLRAVPESPVFHDQVCLIYRPETRHSPAGRAIRDAIAEGLAKSAVAAVLGDKKPTPPPQTK